MLLPWILVVLVLGAALMGLTYHLWRRAKAR
jgi:hypothetical protein